LSLQFSPEQANNHYYGYGRHPDAGPPTDTLTPVGGHSWQSTPPERLNTRAEAAALAGGRFEDLHFYHRLQNLDRLENVLSSDDPSEEASTGNEGSRTISFNTGNNVVSFTTTMIGLATLPNGRRVWGGPDEPSPYVIVPTTHDYPTILLANHLHSLISGMFTGRLHANGGFPGWVASNNMDPSAPSMLSELAMLDVILQGGFGRAPPGSHARSQEEFDRIISELMEQTANLSFPGPPGASTAAISSLPKKNVDPDMLGDSNTAECTICMADVELGETVTELYCKHWFHTDCIKVWLEQHNTCPHCRLSIEDSKKKAFDNNPPNDGSDSSDGSAAKKRAGSSSWQDGRPSSSRPDGSSSSQQQQQPQQPQQPPPRQFGGWQPFNLTTAPRPFPLPQNPDLNTTAPPRFFLPQNPDLVRPRPREPPRPRTTRSRWSPPNEFATGRYHPSSAGQTRDQYNGDDDESSSRGTRDYQRRRNDEREEGVGGGFVDRLGRWWRG
jgi:hypothetical protein